MPEENGSERGPPSVRDKEIRVDRGGDNGGASDSDYGDSGSSGGLAELSTGPTGLGAGTSPWSQKSDSSALGIGSPGSLAGSPMKKPQSSILPPITPGGPESGLNIPKRRRLDQSSSPLVDAPPLPKMPQANSEVRATPQKPRSATSPVQARVVPAVGKRTPSLQDRPIPVLSPPPTETPDPTPGSTPDAGGSRRLSSPLASRTRD